MFESSYRVHVESYFEAAHNLRSCRGLPDPLHGHSWKVEVELEATDLNSEGIVVDLAEVKEKVEAITKKLDRTYINEVPPFTDIAPSGENIARWYAENLKDFVKKVGARAIEVRVWLGRDVFASYISKL